MAKRKPVVTNREYKRVMDQIRRMEKRGYRFSDEYLEYLKSLKAKRKSSALKKIKAEQLYKKAEYAHPVTGEALPGSVGRKMERHERSLKAAETVRRRRAAKERVAEGQGFYPNESDLILGNLENMIKRVTRPATEYGITGTGKKAWKPVEVQVEEQSAKDLVLRQLRQQIDKEGKEAFATRISGHSQEISDLIDTIEYSRYKGQPTQAAYRLSEIITGGRMSGSDRSALASFADYESW